MSEVGNNSHSKSESESVTRETVREALEDGPYAAFIISSVAVGLLFAGWLFFYFVLFMSRGHVG